jgi:hypothetical protein
MVRRFRSGLRQKGVQPALVHFIDWEVKPGGSGKEPPGDTATVNSSALISLLLEKPYLPELYAK